MKRKKIIRAGRLCLAAVYTVPQVNDQPHVRAAKMRCSSAARQRMNIKQSARKLELLIAANFAPGDLTVTLTYDNEHLPTDRQAAVQRLRKFLRQLKAVRRSRGQQTPYIYVTEGLHDGGRVHHHLILNAVGNDLEEIQSLWPCGLVELDKLGAVSDFCAIAEYLTKEPRDGLRGNGARCWTPSLGLNRPVEENTPVDDDLTLAAPPGAIILESDGMRNEWGEFAYIKYILPAPPRVRRRRTRKKK